jgi:glyoxylase-like metal-dependent hydrolase (beta-lactamase superfamily II)
MQFGGPSDTIDPHASPETGSVRRIAPDVWRIVAPNPGPLTGPGTNSYVVGASRRIVIDPGPVDDGHIDRILEVTGGRVERILCTHSHPDHSPGAALLKARTGAPVHGLPPPDDGHQDPTYAPDCGWADGDTIEDEELRLQVLHTPGHASNHVCLLAESSGLLFTGDHLMSGSTVVILPPDGSMRLYLESLRRLRGLPVRELAPGHGSLIADAHAEIDRVTRHRLAREAKLAAALEARGAATLDDVLPQVYDDVPKFMHPVARYSLLAHLIKLEEERRVLRNGDTWTWAGE